VDARAQVQDGMANTPFLPVVKVRWSVAGARATRDSEDSKFSAGKIEA